MLAGVSKKKHKISKNNLDIASNDGILVYESEAINEY